MILIPRYFERKYDQNINPTHSLST